MDNDSDPDGESSGGHDPTLPDLEQQMPEISFDFQSRGDDNDTTINGSQEAVQYAADFEFSQDDDQEHALQALLQVNTEEPAVEPLEQEVEEQFHTPTAPMAFMDDLETPDLTDTHIEEETPIVNGDVVAEDVGQGPTNPIQFVVEVPGMSDERRHEYVTIQSDIVEAVKGEDISANGSMFYNVRFTDGREELVSSDYFFLFHVGGAMVKIEALGQGHSGDFKIQLVKETLTMLSFNTPPEMAGKSS